MLSWPIVALLNNVVQLPGDESRLVHSVDSLRHRNAEEPGANARPLQTPTSIETTVMFGAAETYLPLLFNSLLPYEPREGEEAGGGTQQDGKKQRQGRKRSRGDG